MSWVDGTLVVLVLLLAAVGWFRGLVAQLASVAALLLGVWCGVAVKQWVGAHWQGAHPAVIFVALSWLVAILSSLAVVSLIHALGDRLGRSIQSGPAAAFDHTLGIAAGAALGVVLACLLVLAAVRLPMGHSVERALGASRSTRPLLSVGAQACDKGRAFPGALGLRREFLLARRRLARDPSAAI